MKPLSGSEGENEGLWDATDVASYLKVSRSWVYQRSAAGTLPCLHVGGLVRFDPATIRAFARGVSPDNARVLPFPVRGR